MNAAGPAEHILIEDETSSEVIAPETLTKRLLLDNRLLDSRTELAFYAEGFIRVRTGSAARMRSDHLCELNFLSSEPLLVRQIAWSWGAAALLALLAILVPAVLIPGLQAAVLTPVLVILGGAAVLFTGQFLRRSYVDYRFVTITGRVPVFALRASLGCLRGVRAPQRKSRARLPQWRARRSGKTSASYGRRCVPTISFAIGASSVPNPARKAPLTFSVILADRLPGVSC